MGDLRVAYEDAESRILVTDSLTYCDEPANRRDVVCAGSHGGRVNTRPVLAMPPRGVIAFDGGMARDGSGVGGLALLDEAGIPAAAVASASARIGDAASAWETGTLSAVNRAAARAGVTVGMTVGEAAGRLLGQASGA